MPTPNIVASGSYKNQDGVLEQVTLLTPSEDGLYRVSVYWGYAGLGAFPEFAWNDGLIGHQNYTFPSPDQVSGGTFTNVFLAQIQADEDLTLDVTINGPVVWSLFYIIEQLQPAV